MSATLVLAVFLVVGLALASILVVPKAVIVAAAAVGVGAGLVCYGLFNSTGQASISEQELIESPLNKSN